MIWLGFALPALALSLATPGPALAQAAGGDHHHHQDPADAASKAADHMKHGGHDGSEPGPADAKPAAPAAAQVPEKGLDLEITADGFVPSALRVSAGQVVVLRITRKTDATCAKDIVVPGLVAKTALPLDRAVEVRFVAPKSGTIRYGCAMDQMIGGTLLID